MPLEAISPRRALLAERVESSWRQPLLRLALAWSVLFALFASDWAEMARLYWDISTYNHILLVPVIIAWLVWQRAPQLAKLAPQAWWPGVALVAGSLFIWLLGDISGTATLSHVGIVTAMQFCVVTLLGPRVAWALLFPLAFGLFLIPIGEELVPALQMITAHITIALTHASGIPAVIDGVFIDTPAGLFEVAEACSGVKFLIAMIALGTLVSHVCFRSWPRRAVFMLAAVLLPILANGVRAWGTIYIAQSEGISFAAGFDHIFYGWIFFALVMAALIAMGWRFFDRQVDDPFIDTGRVINAGWPDRLERFNGNGWSITAAVAGVALVMLMWSTQARSVEAELPARIELPEIEGWTRSAVSHGYPWEARAGGADHKLVGTYRDRQGRTVDVIYALYAAQEDGREAGAFGEGALPPDGEWRWLASADAPRGATGDRLQALGLHQRVAYTWYRHGDWTGSSRLQLKLSNMQDRLIAAPQPTIMLILSAEDTASQNAEETMGAFIKSTSPLPEWMDAVAGLD
ncbi:exosortase A [Aurantiacibacter rhizosphaerae]|uniref:Exosortase A n=1 Tax=Aurantiacibacter rhizosphaerae TaxID=2691582 RepID=A0A844XE47_9SPHN|nr:exosortase A [Aurantiacibacter rhizosphaerae]MWV27874.1 exosortase A [Aurantiacibacter rhizosphaerae]